jgi:thiol-disulfide isomerase/thioredoxin
MKTELPQPLSPTPLTDQDPSDGQAGLSRRRALACLGYGAAGLAAVSAGYLAWGQKNRAAVASPALQYLHAAHLQNLNGTNFDAAAFAQRQVLVINFWAPWCPPCVEELPLINQQLLTTPHKKAKLLAIAIDDLDKVQRFWRARQLPAITPAVAGYAGMAVMRQLGNEQGQLPFTVVLGADGAILHSHLGALKAADMQHILALTNKI